MLNKISKKMLDFNPATKEETGDIALLTTTDKTNLVKAVNENKLNIDNHKDDTESHVTLADKTNWNGKATVASVTAVDNKVGDITTLTTTDKTNTVKAINENKQKIDDISTKIGDIATLKTDNKSSIVASSNEILEKFGNLSNLTTSTKSNLVTAINEHDTEIGSLTNLQTTDKTNLVNAINENNSKIDNLKKSGTTAQRPTNNTFVGQPYFDTDLNKPVWRNKTNDGWVEVSSSVTVDTSNIEILLWMGV